MMRRLALSVLLCLSACATSLPQVVEREGATFDVRYDADVQTAAEADLAAAAHCPSGGADNVSQQTGFDGFAYRTYRCVTPIRPN